MTLKPQELAETLFAELIHRKHCDVPETTNVEPAAVPALEEKIRLYQFTTILLAILNEAHKRPEFIQVREHFERLYFPPSVQFDILWDVRAAMDDLSKLLTPEEADRTNTPTAAGKALFWARDWLASIGIEENNPVTLDLLALRWMDYYITVANCMKNFNPIANR